MKDSPDTIAALTAKFAQPPKSGEYLYRERLALVQKMKKHCADAEVLLLEMGKYAMGSKLVFDVLAQGADKQVGEIKDCITLFTRED